MSFSDEMKTMCGSLHESRADRQKWMGDFDKSCQSDRHNREKQGMERRSYLKKFFGDVHVLIQHFHSDHEKMAEEMRKMLEAYCGNIAKEVRGMLKEFRTHHKAMSGQQREELAKFYKGLQSEVGKMRKGFQQTQKALHADFEEAHKIYQGFARQEESKRAMRQGQSKGHSGQILSALKGEPSGMTRKELSYAMGMEEGALGKYLDKMKKNRMIKQKKGIYSAA